MARLVQLPKIVAKYLGGILWQVVLWQVSNRHLFAGRGESQQRSGPPRDAFGLRTLRQEISNAPRRSLRPTFHVLIIALLTSACAHQPPAIPPSPAQIDKVVLPAFVDGAARFCIEDLYHNGVTVCAWDVRQIREWGAKQRNADE